jgi:uncharacterized protein YukE
MTELAVELSDLRGWAAQVGRAGADGTGLSDYASSHVTDGDFGAILDLITGDYEALIPAFHSVLATDGERLEATGASLETMADRYRDLDARVAQEFGVGARIIDDGRADGFRDVADASAVPTPTSTGEELPEVSFGFPFDQLCDLMSSIGGPDPREYVTQWIAGDVGKASLHASAWEHAADGVKAMERNLASGSAAIGRTWDGRAAVRSAEYVEEWVTALSDQASGMSQVSAHLRDMIRQAVDMAQVVVDIIKTVVATAAAAWSNAYIPIYGQIKLVDKVRDLIKLVNDARTVITMFWSALVLIKDGIVMVMHSFDVDALPLAPATP